MRKKKIHPRDLELLFELNCLRFISRTWNQFLGLDSQNLAEHQYRVVWLALLIAKAEDVIDTEKIMRMALVHDVVESRTGDANYMQRQYVKQNEEMAMKDIFAETLLQEEFLLVWQEYDKRESIEAKIVKDADNLDVDMTLKEQHAKGQALPTEWFEHRKKIVKKTLYTATAKELFDKIWQANPHDWHLKGRNRINGGDWKK